MKEKRSYYDPNMYGTEQYWLHPIYKQAMKYTDSVRYFMKTKSAFWTLDVCASYLPKLKKKEFVTFIFDVTDSACEFRAENGNGKVLVKQEIPYTDLDVNVKFFFTNNVLMFPSDY